MRKSSPPLQGPPPGFGASFRDPAGLVFRSNEGRIFRQINYAGKADYEFLISSGLYDSLTKEKLLVSHTKAALSRRLTKDAFAVIEPETVPFISYPFEWSFSQLQDAATLTLQVQRRALKYGMTLKDASAYNIQFMHGKPVFIDTLSFERYEPDQPWQAYRQFCQHFLAPLALMAYTDFSLSQLLRVQLDGVPLDLTGKLLPFHAKIRPGIAMHIVMHGKAQKAKAADSTQRTRKVSRNSLEAILDSLERVIANCRPKKKSTEWGDYYDKTNYTVSAADEKARLIMQLVKPLKAKTALDLGGNNGRYSRVLNELEIRTVCADIDPNAVEANYIFAKQYKEKSMLPLLIDLTNPGGSLGWANRERQPIQERLQVDIVMALALIHHLAIANNLPFSMIARYFSVFAPYLILEFVPKDDSQVQKLLATRKDIFPSYDAASLKQEFEEYYILVKEAKIKDSKRILYLFKRR